MGTTVNLVTAIKSILDLPHETAAARLALSQALTGRVAAEKEPYQFCPICGEWDGCKCPKQDKDKEKGK